MSTIKFKVDATNQIKKLSDKIKKIEESVRLENLKKVFNRLGTIWTGNVRQTFINSKDLYGETWPELKNPSKKRGGSSARPLLDTGRLVGSINFVMQDNNLIISTNLPYAQFHQDGTNRIRKRAFLPDNRGLPDKFKRDLEQSLESIIKNMV